MGLNSESLSSAEASHRYTSELSGNIELAKATPTGMSEATNAPCRLIRINAGTGVALSLRYANGCTDTIPNLNAGDELKVKAAAILASGTTATDVTVLW